MDLPDSGRFPRDRTYSGTHQETALLPNTGLSPSMAELFFSLLLAGSLVTPVRCAPQPQWQSHWFRLFRVRSPLLTEARFLSIPAVTEMFHFAAFAIGNLGINACLTATPSLSQPSTPLSLLAPRHPPYALNCLTTFTFGSRLARPNQAISPLDAVRYF